MTAKKLAGLSQPLQRSDKTRAAATVVVENVNHPGKSHNVKAAPYNAMRRAILKVLPATSPGLNQAEMFRAVLPHLPDDLFPGGAKASWWAKTVQLDLEARKVIEREKTKPLRWRRL